MNEMRMSASGPLTNLKRMLQKRLHWWATCCTRSWVTGSPSKNVTLSMALSGHFLAMTRANPLGNGVPGKMGMAAWTGRVGDWRIVQVSITSVMVSSPL